MTHMSGDPESEQAAADLRRALLRQGRAEGMLSRIQKIAEEDGPMIELGAVLGDLDHDARIGLHWSMPDKLAAVSDLALGGRIVLTNKGGCVFIGLSSGVQGGAGLGDYD